MTMTERLRTVLGDIPVAHRMIIGVAAAALVMGAVVFAQWVAEPTYSVLYADLDASAVSQVIEELEGQSTPYRLENGGSTVLVPKNELFSTRARLAGQGIATSAAPAGYELLDGGGLTISDFEQRVDFKRAVEGELAKTLMAMDAIEHAQVLLVIPEDELFREAEGGATASVLVRPARDLRPDEVETIAFLVSSAVEDLDADQVTIADTDGRVLSVPGQMAGAATVTDRNLRMTQEFEATLAADITRLLDSAVGTGRASVVVNAVLDFDERERESETYTPDSQVALREQTTAESYQGTGTPVGGVVGVDGGPVESSGDGDESSYDRNEQTVEYGVDRVVDRTRSAPGDIERLSVAIVMDDGTVSGITPPATEEIEGLVTAAIGLDQARGDAIAVSAVAFAAIDEDAGVTPPTQIGSLLDQLPRFIGVLVLAIIAVALLRMTRRPKGDEELEDVEPQPLRTAGAAGALPAADTASRGLEAPARSLQGAPVAEPALVGAGAPAMGGGDPAPQAAVDEGFPASIAELVERQPEEIAMLLRSWLADDGGA